MNPLLIAGGAAGQIVDGLADRQIPLGQDVHYTNAICLGGALLVYNVMSVVRRHLGPRGLLRLFLVPLPPKAEDWQAIPGPQ